MPKPASRFHDILVATDFSAGAEAAARAALGLARALGARLHVLHVTQPSRAAEAAARLRAVGRALREVPLALVVETGDAAAQIVRYARTHQVALIVVGRHGHTGFTGLMLGSVAERVARKASCGVLTVPLSGPRTIEGDRAQAAAGPEAAAGLEVAPGPEEAASRCLVCAGASADLICEGCRARIRGQALEQKWEQERLGRTAT